MNRIACLIVVGAFVGFVPLLRAEETAPAKESNCSDGKDDDDDFVFDCGDHDCHDDAACVADGKPEADEKRCTDFIDNDKDGVFDCEDPECQILPVCQGSWKGPLDGKGGGDSASTAVDATGDDAALEKNPEREMADSNDGVGFAGVRFGVVGMFTQGLEFSNTESANQFPGVMSTTINALQLRAFGSLPFLQDSFFLINVRGERSPRLTFAMFQLPIANGHQVAITTGGGSLSNQVVLSLAKQPLLERASYVTSAFEQLQTAGVEVNGPILPGKLRYRVFAGGGSGLGTGEVGDRFFTYDNFNYSYTAGAQMQMVPLGNLSRFETAYLYRPVPLALSFTAGAKYDQRLQERFPGAHVSTVFRWGHFELLAENYSKAELNFGSLQTAYNVTAGVLLIPEWLFFAADFGQYLASGFGELERVTGISVSDPPDVLETQLRRERGETNARAALHFYFWRNNGVLSTRYAYRSLDAARPDGSRDRYEPYESHDIWLTTQLRF